MKNGYAEAQDFSTSELIEALTERGFEVLTAPSHAEITSAEREACSQAAEDVAREYEGRAHLPHAKGTSLWQSRMDTARGAHEAAQAIRARKDGARSIVAIDDHMFDDNICQRCGCVKRSRWIEAGRLRTPVIVWAYRMPYSPTWEAFAPKCVPLSREDGAT